MGSAVDASPLVGRASEGVVIAAPAAGCRHGATRPSLPRLPARLAGQAILAASPWFTWTSVLACSKAIRRGRPFTGHRAFGVPGSFWEPGHEELERGRGGRNVECLSIAYSRR